MLTITPGTPDFLGVVFEALREIVMKDRTDVRFIDAHAEGDGGDDDPGLARHERTLCIRTEFGG